VGFDQEQSLGRDEVGGRAAAPIWLYFMERALEGKPVEVFPVPSGIVFSRIDPETGRPARKSDVKSIFECFLEGTIPGNGAPVDAGAVQGVIKKNSP
jgi:penicillin-binding protein 1A